MTWRPLRPGELDHEALWLVVSLATAGGAWLWLSLALPTPGCPFHHLTGLPCPTCGMTRSLHSIFRHDWRTAAAFNPLAFLVYGLVAVYDFYAATVVVFRRPRLRFDSVPPRWSRFVRWSVVTTLLANWAWLIWNRV